MNLHKLKTAKVLGFFLSTKFKFKTKKYFIFFLTIFSFVLTDIYGQSNVSIRGQVRDIENDYPLPNVLIQIEGFLYNAYSNEEGYFEIENVQPGTYNVVFTLVGYESITTMHVNVVEDVSTQIIVELKRKILQGETIDVEAEQIENYNEIAGDKIVINVEEERKNGNNNLKKILQQVAGLEIVAPGDGENRAVISIHGSDANQVLVLLDGNRLNNPQTGDVDLSEIPFEEVERIEVIRHGNTAMYGSGAYAGVVHFKTTQHAESPYLSISSKAGSFSTYSGQVSGGIAIGQGFARVNYYQNYSNQNFSYDYENQQFNRENAWYRNRNFYSKLNYRVNSQQLLIGYTQCNSNRGLPSVYFNEQNDFGAKMDGQNRRVFIDYKWLFKPDFYLEAISGYNYLNQSFDNSNDPSPFTKYHNNFTNSTYEAQVIANLQIKNLMTSKLGVQYFKESLEQKDILYPSLNSGENTRETKSIYLGLEYYLPKNKIIWNNLKFSSALRYQRYFTQKAEVFPSLGFYFTPLNIEAINISGNWAKSVRYPDFNSLFWKGGVQSQGNPDLLPEKKTGWNASLKLDLKKDYTPDIYVFYFYEKLTDLIYWEQTRNNHWQPRNLSNAEKEGWDIQLKQNIYTDYILLRTMYSRVIGINKSEDPTTQNKYLVFMPQHTTSASLVCKYKQISSLISFRYVSERQTVKANTAEPLDDYRIWDASINYTEEIGKMILKIEFALDNFNGQQYQLLRGYPMSSKVLSASMQIKYKF